MPRVYEIDGAFQQVIRVEQNGRKMVKTSNFVRELERVNWHWTPREANEWSESYITTFKDISLNEGEERLFMLYNPNGG